MVILDLIVPHPRKMGYTDDEMQTRLLQIGMKELFPDDTGAHKRNKKRAQKNTGEGLESPLQSRLHANCNVCLAIACLNHTLSITSSTFTVMKLIGRGRRPLKPDSAHPRSLRRANAGSYPFRVGFNCAIAFGGGSPWRLLRLNVLDCP